VDCEKELVFERQLCLVILFPVRRVHDKSKVLWNKISELINSNSTLRLVLIDKTINSEATKFFLSLGMNGKIQFLQCDPTESIFLSQSKIKLPPDHWVSQIHDDDDFAGQVIFPSRANNSSVLQPNIRITTSRLATMSYRVPKSKLPASILFSFIPSEIWNLFTGYIRAQGEECSPSLDVALNFVCEKKFQFVEMPSFEYIYHYEHWQSRKHAKKSISIYMDHDGWGIHSDVITAEFASQIDKLLFSVWCNRRLFIHDQTGFLQSAFESITPTRRHILRIQVKIIYLFILIGFVRVFRSNNFLKLKRERVKLLSLIVAAYYSNTSHELAEVLTRISKIPSLHKLNKRFEFWSLELLSSTEIVSRR